MAAITRGKVSRAYVLSETTRLYLEGSTQQQIAVAQGVSIPQVSYDLRVIQRHWQMAQIRDFDALVTRELARIDHLESVYWVEFWASRGDTTVETTERRDGATATAVARVQRKVNVVGDHAWLQGVQWCIDRRIRLLGLDAPQRLTMETVEREADRLADATGFSREEIIDEAQRLLRAGRAVD